MGFSNADEETLTNLRGAGHTDELREIYWNYYDVQSVCGIAGKGEIAQGSFPASAG
jgi:hypothetical protein